MTVPTSPTTNLASHLPAEGENSQHTSARATSSRQAELERPTIEPGMELKPIGIHNESNTCFLNSTFQALSATAQLTTLLSTSPQSPLYIHPNSTLPKPSINPKLIPSLQTDILEPPLYDLLPVTRAFTNSLHRAWRMKENGGGTYGSGETSSKRSMSLNSLLREIARKYDQYDDYSQQDAHELLRHLLDSMEMEEKDCIKKLQPNLPPVNIHSKRRKSSKYNNHNVTRSGTTTPGAGNGPGLNSVLSNQNLMGLNHISPLPSPLPSPAHTRPPSPGHRDVDSISTAVPLNINGQMTGHVLHEHQAFSPSEIPVESSSEMIRLASSEERMIPFVDVLFGGSLASVVVCEKCKAVSHTYEGFLDISLSLKGDDPKPRKRDMFKGLASKFRPRKSSTPQTSRSPEIRQSGIVSEGELSDTEGPKERDRRKSMDSDDRIIIDTSSNNSSGLGRSSSKKGFGGLKSKTSFSFGRKKDKKSASSPIIAPSPAFEDDHNKTPPTSTPPSPSLHSQAHLDRKSHHHRQHGSGPTPAQAAYISRILAPPPGTVDLDDPLAKLRAAQSGQPFDPSSTAATSEYGLVEALRAFTSVEVLEGENAFACKKCWKIKHGYYAKHEATVREEDEEQLAEDGNGLPHTYTRGSVSSNITTSSIGTSPMLIASPQLQQAPQISVLGSPSSDISNTSSSYYDDGGRFGRSTNTSNINKNSIIRAPSPLRRQLEAQQQQEELNKQLSSTTLSSTYGSDSALTMNSLTSTSNTTIDDNSTENLVGKEEIDGEEEDSDGLSDSETSIDENNNKQDNNMVTEKRPKNKRKKTNHVVMGRAFKRYLIAKKPEILVFHFKRFKQTAKSYSFSSFYDLKKIDDFVSFPETLDLAPFLAPNRQDYKVHQTSNGPKATYMEWANPEQGPDLEPVMYRLYAVVVHLGTMIGGHYIAYCLVDPERMFGGNATDGQNGNNNENDEIENKTPTVEAQDQNQKSNASVKSQQSGLSGMSGIGDNNNNNNSKESKKDRRVWCFCSDTSIRLASIEEVLSQKAYLCFYEKVA